MKLYGIPNCTTVKKARAWLDGQAHEVDFHDFKKQGVDATWLRDVLRQTGWQALLNTRGTTWRKLSDAEKAAVTDEAGAIALMLPFSVNAPGAGTRRPLSPRLCRRPISNHFWSMKLHG
jgi:arsenate reductase